MRSFSFWSLVLCSSFLSPSAGHERRRMRSSTQTLTSTDSTTTAAKATATTARGAGMCDRIRPDELPSECTCSEGITTTTTSTSSTSSSSSSHLGLVISCLKHFNSSHFNDTIGLQLTIDPCNVDGASISLDITEETHHIDYPITGIRAGEEHFYPIPGLAIIVPMIGSVGIDADVWIAGNLDELFLKVGLNACTMVRDKFLCASSLPGVDHILPWWIVEGNYTFGDLCNSTTTATATTTSTTTATTLMAMEEGRMETVVATE